MAGDLLLWTSIFAVCYTIFSRTVPLNYLLFPMLIIAAFRLGQFGSALAVGVISIASTYATVNGTGPFSAMNLTGALLLQQGFIGSIATATMVLSAIVAEQKISALKVLESEKRSRMLIEQAPIGIILSRDGIILDANRVSVEMFGFADIQELRGTALKNRFALKNTSEIPDRISEQSQGQSAGAGYETLGLRKDGSQFPFHVSVNRIFLAEGPLTIRFCIDITERKRAEEALQLSELKFGTIFRENPVPLAVSEFETGCFLEVNDALLTLMHATTPAQMLGRTSIEIGMVTPAERVKIIDAVQATGRTDRLEIVMTRLDRRPFVTELTSTSYELAGKRYLLTCILDITERKQAEDALMESEERFRNLFETANDAILLLDGNTFVDCNARAVEMYGCDARNDLLNHTPMEFSPAQQPDGRNSMEKASENINLALSNRPQRFYWKHLRKDGTPLDAEVALNRVEILGHTFLQAIVRDITERIKVEHELQKHREHLEELVKVRTGDLQKSQRALTNIVEDLNLNKEELVAANKKLKEIDHLKSLFIASMSHELRTPLNSIIGFTGILLQGLAGELNTEQRKQLGMVKGSSEHLLSLITDIIDLSKIEAGKIDLSMETFDLSVIVREVMGSFQVMAERKALLLSAEIPSDLMVVSDKRRIRQVLVNLVGNAVKFTEQGGVSVTTQEHGNVLKVSVRDTGMGIRPEDQEKLFKSFSQVTTVEAPKHEGTGLGLYLSRRLITLLGGEIGVESDSGKGSVFFFTLPLGK